jgi:hypothetical protein
MSQQFIPIEDRPDLVRDMETNMILNINKDKIEQHRRLQEAKKKQRNELDELKSDVEQIKTMLRQLLENGTNG